MTDEKFNLIEGCRQLVSLCSQVSEADNEIFFPIRAINSETDHFPIGAMRELCSEEYLEQADKEMAEYLQEVKSDIFSSCKEIINYFEK